MKKKITTLFAFLLFANYAKAQDLEIILLAKDDAEKITDAYLKPAFKGLIYSMNNGWYHTAKVHKKFGFDITIGASASIIPSEDEIFNLGNLSLSNNTSPQSGTSPTIGGSSENGLELTYTEQLTVNDLSNIPTSSITNILPSDTDPAIINAINSAGGLTNAIDNGLITETQINSLLSNSDTSFSATFELPGGVKDDLPMNAVPAPSIQVGLGLPYKFEIIGRITPEVGSDDVKGKIFGLGLKKEITSLFGPMEKTPLHVSLLAAFTKMNVNYTIGNGDISDQISYENAAAEFELKSYTIQAIASLNFPIINFYGGIGYNGGKSTLNMLGDYTLQYEIENTGTMITDTLNNPFSFENSVGGVNATIGTRLSLGFFKIFASYTLQEYNSVNAGIALSFR